MKKHIIFPGRHEIIEKTLKSLTIKKRTHRIFFYLFLVLFFVGAYFTRRATGSSEVFIINRQPIPFASLTGIFSILSNLSLILIVVLFGKTGFLTSMALLLWQTPRLFFIIFKMKNYAVLPGIGTTIFVTLVIILLHLNNLQIEKYQTKLRNLAVIDSLTEIPNRLACVELLNKLIKNHEKFAVVMIDLNNFKGINDTMGHKAGNDVLVEVASRWKLAVDSGLSGTVDFITRQGGDEFTLIIRNYNSEEDILKSISYYESVLEQRIVIRGKDYFITASFGYAEFPTDADNFDTLFAYSDMAMYQIKRERSSNHILHFTPELLKISEYNTELERRIRTALLQNTIYFKLQPQYDMSHNLRGFEALARMNDTENNVINPDDFIPIAEKIGLIDSVDHFVFENSAKFFGDLIKKTGTDITLSINISVRHLINDDFIAEVQSILNTYGIPAKQLEIEITESIMLDSEDKSLERINELKKMGIKIAIDDFGTGYSSLSYLTRIPADLLKIDKSFINKMNSSESSKQYVATIISIGHTMKFDVISEGVEKEEQLETLRSIGCDLIQGYLWGRPMMPEDAAKLITK